MVSASVYQPAVTRCAQKWRGKKSGKFNKGKRLLRVIIGGHVDERLTWIIAPPGLFRTLRGSLGIAANKI